MDRLDAMRATVRVAETGNLSAAARAMGVAPSAVSRAIAGLEDRLGARLFQRSTRRVTTTEVGAAYVERCRRILADLNEAEDGVVQSGLAPRGTLRVNMPYELGRLHIVPHLSGFLRRHPQVKLDVTMTDRFIDPAAAEIDVLIRVAEPGNLNFVGRKLGENRRAVVASPAYWKARGKPMRPEDLSAHDCLLYSYLSSGETWTLTGADGVRHEVAVSGRLRVNTIDALRVAALDGLGVAMAATWLLGPDLRAGRLVAVLDDYVPAAPPIYVLYPPGRHLSPKVRAFVDFLVALFTPAPPWERPASRIR
ncbi:MAG: LysR family transcriptional regulator [Alphaproteobacteria bacterium]|nr:LysR family transcriptional regulator [Alphaproteobacteria bacterium]